MGCRFRSPCAPACLLDAGGSPNADFFALWDGTSWARFVNSTGPAFGGNVQALQIIGSTPHVGGTGAGHPVRLNRREQLSHAGSLTTGFPTVRVRVLVAMRAASSGTWAVLDRFVVG